MTVLVDTSVWINHFRKANSALGTLLEEERVHVHPFVIGELACGQLRHRAEIINLLTALPFTTKATDDEVLFLIDRHRLMGKGLGLIDIHLLASSLTDRCHLWTADKPLAAVASRLKLAWEQ